MASILWNRAYLSKRNVMDTIIRIAAVSLQFRTYIPEAIHVSCSEIEKKTFIENFYCFSLKWRKAQKSCYLNAYWQSLSSFVKWNFPSAVNLTVYSSVTETKHSPSSELIQTDVHIKCIPRASEFTRVLLYWTIVCRILVDAKREGEKGGGEI